MTQLIENVKTWHTVSGTTFFIYDSSIIAVSATTIYNAFVVYLDLVTKIKSAISIPAGGNLNDILFGYINDDYAFLRPKNYVFGSIPNSRGWWAQIDSTGAARITAANGTGSTSTLAAATENIINFCYPLGFTD